MYYPQEVLDEVLANNDIVDIVSSHVHLKKRGRNYVGLCPFHNEKTPSFNVNPERNTFHCFGCGTGGNAITFLMKYNSCSFQEAVQELADRAQITLPAPRLSEESKAREKHRQDILAVNRDAAIYYYRLLRSPTGARGLKYFTDRGLSPEIMKMFGLGFADGMRSDLTAYLRKKGYSDELILESDVAGFNEKQGLHDRFWNRVMFPIMDVRGKVIGFGGRVLGDSKPKYINSSENAVFDKGRNLYALHLARRSRSGYLILCEGYMDVIAMHQAGFTESVASLGTAFTPGQASLLRRYADRILLAYDSDAAGVRAALRNIEILRKGGLESAVIDLRPFKDPDEFIKNKGKEAFQTRIDKAENSFFYELRILSDSYNMSDPASRTAFHREIARKLCVFSDDVERDNYLAACAEKYFIRKESLRNLVARYGEAVGYGDDSARERGSRRAGYSDPAPSSSARPWAKRESAAVYGSGQNVLAASGSGIGKSAAGGSGSGSDGSRRDPPAPVSRKDLANWKKQRMLMTMIADNPAVFEEADKYIKPRDFGGDLFQKAASALWEQMKKGGDPGAAARVISAFDTPEEQEAVAAMFNTYIDGDSGEVPPKESGDISRTLQELLIFVKESSVERMSRSDGEDAVSLTELLEAKKSLQRLRSAAIRL